MKMPIQIPNDPIQEEDVLLPEEIVKERLGVMIVEMTESRVRGMAEDIGKTNLRHNQYATLLNMAAEYRNAGLVPRMFVHQLTGAMYVTSEERIRKTLN